MSSSSQDEAAIDGIGLTRYVARGIAAEPQEHVGVLLLRLIPTLDANTP